MEWVGGKAMKFQSGTEKPNSKKDEKRQQVGRPPIRACEKFAVVAVPVILALSQPEPYIKNYILQFFVYNAILKRWKIYAEGSKMFKHFGRLYL